MGILILRKAKNLKPVQGLMSSVYVKKVVHPAVRKDVARLIQREKEEKEKLYNFGVRACSWLIGQRIYKTKCGMQHHQFS